MPDQLDRQFLRAGYVLAILIGLLAVCSAAYGFSIGRGAGTSALAAGGVGMIAAGLLAIAARWVFGALEGAQK